MKFIEIYFSLVNTAHIISVTPNEVQLDSGDYEIIVLLSNGSIIKEYEVSYKAMLERCADIGEKLNARD